MSRFACESNIALRVNSSVAVKALAALMRLGHTNVARKIIDEGCRHAERLADGCCCHMHRHYRPAPTGDDSTDGSARSAGGEG